MRYHEPVLLREVVDCLKPAPGKLYIDATVGGGAHTFEIIKHGARVLGIDRDPEAIEYIKKEVKGQKPKISLGEDLVLVNENFNKIGEIAKSHGFEKVNGILFDLGVSSHQLEKAARGFAFRKSGPLDMRMDPTLAVKASDIINNFDQRRLNEIFETFAQEQLSWPIADAICSARTIKPIETTQELTSIIGGVYRKKGQKTKIDPATKVFLALRIIVNSELLNLEEALPQTIDLLKDQGRLVTISFHSLEDAIVKRFFKQQKKLIILTKKPIVPSSREVLRNPRARSARLRAAKKV